MLRSLGAILAGAVLVLAAARASIAESGVLDDQIAALRAEIAEADLDAQKYGGALKLQAELRRQILKVTEAMLVQKQTASAQGIELSYVVEGRPLPGVPTAQLAAIEREIAEAEVAIAEAEFEAARYSGGILLTMSLVNVVTSKVTRAVVVQRYTMLKYGIFFPAEDDETDEESAESPTKARSLSDNEAL